MENNKILVVEDEEDISELVCYNLKKQDLKLKPLFQEKKLLENLKKATLSLFF
jgi:DNA-binding response OmpR family regulator